VARQTTIFKSLKHVKICQKFKKLSDRLILFAGDDLLIVFRRCDPLTVFSRGILLCDDPLYGHGFKQESKLEKQKNETLHYVRFTLL